MSEELQVINNAPIAIIDTIDTQLVAATLQKIANFQAVISKTLVEGKDYGKIPGAGDKPSLFKAGAEKINMLFGLNPEYEFLKADEDYKNGFFNYSIRCTLYRNGAPVSQGVGNCNSMEKKYRYITTDESGLAEYGIAPEAAQKYTDRHGRTRYRINNPEPYSIANTVLKMAKKRAYVDATLQVASLSDLFTQDLEDMRDVIEQEAENTAMTYEEACNIVLPFGRKYKGLKLGSIYKTDPSYIRWLADKSDDPVVSRAAKIILSAPAPAVAPAQKAASTPKATPKPSGAPTPPPPDDKDAPPDDDDIPLPWEE